MANPTTNFGWQMPTSTDLVTDLPADFEVFGQAVDTSMADLKGGTTGQMLTKATNTDMDFTWVTPQVGDITAVNVTAPITGGGTSGAVTIGVDAGTTLTAGVVQLTDSTSSTSTTTAATPNSVKSAYDLANAAIAKSTLTTSGDILYRNATVPTRLGIGSTGQVLTVSSGAPAWVTPAATSPTFVGCSIQRTNTSTAITNGAEYLIQFTSEEYDTDGFHDNSTNNSRITIPTGKGDKYLIAATSSSALSNVGSYCELQIWKNGGKYTSSGQREGRVFRTSGGVYLTYAIIVAAAAGDYIEIGYQAGNTETVNMWFTAQATWLGA